MSYLMVVVGHAAVLISRFEQCDEKKSPNVYGSCPKMISLEKWHILTPLQKLPKNVRDYGKLLVAKGFKKLPNLVTLPLNNDG